MPSDITPCLWFDGAAEEAARCYTSLFDDSRIVEIVPWGESGPAPEGSAMLVSFELRGRPFSALNGGPQFAFNEAVSFSVGCADQEEVDRYWDALTADGGEEGQCGWCKDRWGVSWQVVPTRLTELLTDPDPAVSNAAFAAMMPMRRIELSAIEEAVAGVPV